MGRIKIGSVHGRFQPFHNGHLDYVVQAFDRADFVYVGLTQIFRPLEAEDQARSRETPEANPLNFWERRLLVDAALESVGVSRERYSITPFPIESPKRLGEFIPQGSCCFTTIVTDWNEEKITRLGAQGFTVEVLQTSNPDNIRVTTGTDIRRLLRLNDPSWARFVPPSVAELISSEFRDRF